MALVPQQLPQLGAEKLRVAIPYRLNPWVMGRVPRLNTLEDLLKQPFWI
tara:strand:+ start:578 stop:724 length:147 start_codon:yes stop_codon:yes gene_type:complete